MRHYLISECFNSIFGDRMNKHMLSIGIVTYAILVASAFAQNQSILPGGCVIPKKRESISLSNHSITVKAGQELPFYF
jgi:hypothetical protein